MVAPEHSRAPRRSLPLPGPRAPWSVRLNAPSRGSYVFVGATPGLESTVLELPEVCRTGEKIRSQQPDDVQQRVTFTELDATSPDWPTPDAHYDVVLMSYISGSVPEPVISALYSNAYKALKPGRRLC